MKDHYHTKPSGSRRPLILGLTASSIFNPKNPAKSISDLEANLDARILEVSGQHHEALNNVAPKPSEQLIEFETNDIVVEPTALETKFMETYGARLDSKTMKKMDVTRIVRCISPCEARPCSSSPFTASRRTWCRPLPLPTRSRPLSPPAPPARALDATLQHAHRRPHRLSPS